MANKNKYRIRKCGYLRKRVNKANAKCTTIYGFHVTLSFDVAI